VADPLNVARRREGTMGARNRAWLVASTLVATGCWGGPVYEPGAVRRGTNLRAALDAPEQTEREFWPVEPDVKLFHFADGSGRPVLVLHGGPAIPTDEPWAGLRSVDGFSFHYFHQRGCGRSTRPFDAFSGGWFYSNMKELERTLGLGAQIADVERVRRILGQERLVLVGHSFGALIAALYAAEFPEHVSALVLESPADLLVVPSPTGGIFAEVEARLPAPQRAEFQAYLERYLDFGHLFQKTEAQLAALHQEFGSFYAAALRANGVGAAESLVRAPAASQVGGFMPQAVYLSMGRKHDWRSALAGVRVPVLVLHGERDLQPLSASRAFAAAFPNAELRVIPGASHYAHAEQPQAFAREVRAFLEASRL
jgi:proline iminopeptidase